MAYLRIILCVSLFTPFYALAVDDIVADCQALKQNFSINIYNDCYQYINGFIDGAVITDEAIVEQLNTSDYEHLSNYMQRVYRTRARRNTSHIPATLLAGFCLPTDQQREQVIETIIQEIDIDQGQLGENIYITIKRLYPCSN